MQSDRDKTGPSSFWLFGLIAVTAATAAAFWLLLGWRYSPETYDVMPITPDTVEFVWYGLSLAAAVVCVCWLLGQRGMWQRTLWSSIPLVVVCVFIIVRAAFGVSLRCYDMLLFCTV